eukprot:UN08508
MLVYVVTLIVLNSVHLISKTKILLVLKKVHQIFTSMCHLKKSIQIT